MISKIVSLIVLGCFLSGCATFEVSKNLNERIDIPSTQGIEGDIKVLVRTSYKQNQNIKSFLINNETKQIIVDAIVETSNQVKFDIIFEENKFNTPYLELDIISEQITGNCYLGGCVLDPWYWKKLTYKVVASFYDVNGKIIFQDQESISGLRRGAVLDFSIGINKIDLVRTQGLPKIIKKTIFKMYQDETFKKSILNETVK